MISPNDDEDDEAAPTEQLTVDASDKEAVREQNKKLGRADREAAEFWQQVFAHPIGRREMWNLLTEMGTFETRFGIGPNGFPNPESTWFNAGQQDFGLRLYFSWLRLDRAGVLLMQDEFDPNFPKPKRAVRRRDPN